jgi:hypothetical protein
MHDVEVVCRRPTCGDPYTAHDPGGGACQAGAEERECWCPGFRWVDPTGELPAASGGRPVSG